MKDVLKFKTMQEMCNEADEYVATIKDEDVKACAKLLMISCYSYMTDFMKEDARRTYQNVSTLIKYELIATGRQDVKSKFQEILANTPDRTTARRVYELYYACPIDIKKRAQMLLMAKLLPQHITK